MKTLLPPIPIINENEATPLVSQLVDLIEQQGGVIKYQAETIQLLKDEIARLTKNNQKPKIRKSRLEGSKEQNKQSEKKKTKSVKKKKTAELKIDETIDVKPEFIPENSTFKGYKEFVIQDIRIKTHNIKYRLERWLTPDGQYVCGELPDNLNGKHFGCDLISFILYQYYHCHVTQPLLLEQLEEFGLDISSGQLNNILIENKEHFHKEKDAVISAGIEVSSYINVDDTGARHKGKNGYCTHIGNELFSYFESTESKSRINFLKLLRAGHTDYHINTYATEYMEVNRLPKHILNIISLNLNNAFVDDVSWNDFLVQNGIEKERHVQIATEGALIGSIAEHGISDNLIIVSDDAGQFNVLLHALCWIHAERTINKIILYTDKGRENLKKVQDQIWEFYNKLKLYKDNPCAQTKKELEAEFDEIFTQKTQSSLLDNALKRIYNNKAELLLVLEHPDIPLHNNTAERGIREYVKKRKISGSTRSEAGRRSRDTFTSLKQTCRKLGISFFEYVKDRVKGINVIPSLSQIIRQKALNPG